MAVRFGHASVSENGTINGSKGDSTKKEVCVRTWYNGTWDFMAIHPDETVRANHAVAVEDACNNDNIGYGQGDRNTLNTEAKKVAYDLSKIANKCNCDCSSLQNVAAMASGAKGVSYASNGWTTRTMRNNLKSAGYVIVDDKTYLTSSAYCVKGAIYVREGKHTVCGLDNGSNYNATLEHADLNKTNKVNTSASDVKMESATTKNKEVCTVELTMLKKGTKGNSVKALQTLLIGYGYSCGKSGADGDFGSGTLSAVKAYQKATGLTVDGVVGSATWGKLLGTK